MEHNSHLAKCISAIRLVVTGLIVGIVASLAAIFLVDSIKWLNDLFFISANRRHSAELSDWLPVISIAVPTIGGLIVGYLCLSMSQKKSFGIPDCIRVTHTDQASIPLGDGLKSALAAIISLGCGASLGQYAPLVSLGSTLGNFYNRHFGSYLSLNIGIGCGAASAIATAFNAPLAGLIFAHEVILRHYSFRAFAPITIAATTGYVIASVILERPPLLKITALANIQAIEYLFFILIGIGGALIAYVFVKLIFYLQKISNQIHLHPPLKTAAAGMFLGIIALFIPEILSTSQSTIGLSIVPEGMTTERIIIIFIAKLVLTAICLAFGFVGGVFNPSIVLGVLFGTLVASNIHLFIGYSHAPIAVYAICGMVAVASPVIGAPLSSILIVLEITRHYEITTAAMLCVACSNLVAYRLFGRSFFDLILLKQNIDLSYGREKVFLEQHKILPYVNTGVVTYQSHCDTPTVFKGLRETDETEAYILNEKQQYIGTITLNQFANDAALCANESRQAQTIAKKEALIFDSETSIWQAMNRMQDFVGESIPVIQATQNGDDQQPFIGVVYESQVIKAYLDIMERIRTEEKSNI